MICLLYNCNYNTIAARVPGEVHHAAADGDRGAAAARVEAGHGGGAR